MVFSNKITINNLEYVLSGNKLAQPDDLVCGAAINADEQAQVLAQTSTTDAFLKSRLHLLGGMGLGDGTVGKPNVGESATEHKFPSSSVSMIYTDTDYLTEELGYRGVKGVGCVNRERASHLEINLCFLSR